MHTSFFRIKIIINVGKVWQSYGSFNLKEGETHCEKSFAEVLLQNEQTNPLCSTGITLINCSNLRISRSDRFLQGAQH